jgi:predicted PurR-regulated permease PerM
LIAGGIFLIFLLWYFSAIVTYILISVVLSFVGRPLVKWLSLVKYKKIRIPKGVAAFITLIAMWFVFISFFRFIIPLLIKELETLSEIDLKHFSIPSKSRYEDFCKFQETNLCWLKTVLFTISVDQLTAKIDFHNYLMFLFLWPAHLENFSSDSFAVSFITFFFLKEKSMVREGILLIVPTNLENKVSNILNSISYLLRRYFVGLILEVFMVMLLDTIGLNAGRVEF